ncbi:MAG: hypothetical protein A2X86_02375 [Bdellovibrionales bacterium GWA2_49_15]|nr:MAG: hypothetical protein A2X86_02375 [Bdellovibrionales bacterium GWA2_49_15]
MKQLLIICLLFSLRAEAELGKAFDLYLSNKAQKQEWIAYEMMTSEHFFVASIFAKRHILSQGEHSTIFEEALETIATKAGIEALSDLPDEVMQKTSGATMTLVLGLRRFREKHYQAAIDALKTISPYSRFYPEALMVIGPSLYFLGSGEDKIIQTYQTCSQSAEKMAKDASHEKLRRYYELIRENCLIHLARQSYSKTKFNDSTYAYEKITKQSYRWPYILLERAWTSFKLGDYNRALGLVATYGSPLLESYFFPEAEIVKAVSYHRLCLYDDALQVVENYYQNYKPKSEALETALKENKDTFDFFLNLMFEERSEREKVGPYVAGLAIQIRKEVKFNLDLITLRRAEEELQSVLKWPDHPMKKDVTYEIMGMISHLKKKMNFYVMERMVSFVNEIHRTSYEMFNIKLDILSKKRNLIYKGEKLVADRARGELKNVKRRADQHYYEFIGEFWADELGEYSFGLKSNCETLQTRTTSTGGQP